MATILDYDLRDTFDFERKILLYSGFFPNEGKMNKNLYYLSRLFHISVFLMMYISMVVFIAMNITSLSTISEVILIFMTVTAFIYKLTNLTLKKKRVVEIENMLTNPVFYGLSSKNLQVIKDHVKVVKNVASVFRFLCFWAVILYALYPFLGNTEEYLLPFAGWTPLNVTYKINYWFTYMCQLLGYGAGAFVSSGIDMFNLTLIAVATSLFEILKNNLNDIKYDSKEATDKFTEQVRLHYEIIRFVNAIEDIFSYGVFYQFLSSVLIICFTGFQMVIVPKNSIQFYHLFTYLNCMLVQVGMYCFFGHDVIATSDKVNESIYMSNWYESDLRLRKHIMIFMERCKKPSGLTGAQFFPLSLETFTGIIKSSYSYFALLRRLCGPEE